jgi:hypothetical protein
VDVFDHEILMPTNTQTVELLPLGCIHADTEGFDAKLFAGALARVKANPLARVIGLGDYFDFARSAYRKHLQAYQGDEDSRKSIDHHVIARTEEFARKYLEPIKAQILGFSEGNHHYAFADGTTDTQLLCRLLDVRYFGVASWHRLVFRHRTGSTVKVLSLFAHHGNWGGGGGGRTKGASRNAADIRAVGRMADIIVFAHDHKPDAWSDKWQTVSHRGPAQITYRRRAFVRAGTFMEGEVPGCTTYVERALLRPEEIGYVVLKIQFAQPYSAARYAQRRAMGAPSTDKGHGAAVEHRFSWDVVTGG